MSYKDHQEYRAWYDLQGVRSQDIVTCSGWHDMSKQDVFERFDYFVAPTIPKAVRLKQKRTDKPVTKLYVLDVGCGSALLAHYFSECYPGLPIEYYGIEPEEHRVDIARKNLPKGFPKSCIIQGYAGENGPLEDDTFDLVIASSVFGDLCGPTRELDYNQASEFARDMLHHQGLCVADFWHRTWWEEDKEHRGSGPLVFKDPEKVIDVIEDCDDGIYCSPPTYFDFPDSSYGPEYEPPVQKMYGLSFYQEFDDD